MTTGAPLRDGAPRPEYAPGKLLMEKIDTKVAELNQTKATTSGTITARTFQRWIERYNKYGKAGLIDGRTTRKRKTFAQVDDRLLNAITKTLKDERNASTGTGTRFAERVQKKLDELYPGNDVKMPTDRTILNHAKVLGKGKYTFENATLRRTAVIGEKAGVQKSRPALKPGSEVQVDSSPWDGWVIGLDGKRVRVVVDLMYDKCTGSIIGIGVVPKASRGIDHALMLARCFAPHDCRPIPNFAGPQLEDMPWVKHLTAEQAAEAEKRRPFIVPDRIVIDNGSDYVSDVFRAACAFFGVDLTFSSPGTPTDKAGVERAFHSIKTLLVQYIPGFTGAAVNQRGKGIENDPGLLDIFTLQSLLEWWVTIVWQNRIHEGLRDPYDPSIELSPNAAYQAMFDLVDGFVPVPVTPEAYIEFLPFSTRKISRQGIEINRRRYDSLKLGPFRELPGPKGRGTEDWEVRYDPYNPAAVWVADPDDGTWIQCDWMNNDALIRPFTKATRDTATMLQNTMIGLTDTEARDLAIKLHASMPTAKALAEAEAERNEMNLRLREQKGVNIPVSKTHSAAKVTDDGEDDFVDISTFA